MKGIQVVNTCIHYYNAVETCYYVSFFVLRYMLIGTLLGWTCMPSTTEVELASWFFNLLSLLTVDALLRVCMFLLSVWNFCNSCLWHDSSLPLDITVKNGIDYLQSC